MEPKKYCCQAMQIHLEEQEVAIGYNPSAHEYGIRCKSSQNDMEKIDYCPWCGADLAKIISSS